MMDNINEIESKRLDWLRNEEPYCWESFNVVSQKPFYGKLPIQSLQPGVYQQTKLFSEKQVIGIMKAAYYDGYTDRQIAEHNDNNIAAATKMEAL